LEILVELARTVTAFGLAHPLLNQGSETIAMQTITESAAAWTEAEGTSSAKGATKLELIVTDREKGRALNRAPYGLVCERRGPTSG
jgi:hypothetical protein